MLQGQEYFRGSSVLVSGTAGVGKSSLAATFVDAACRRGERAMYFALEESQHQIVRNMRSIGIDLDSHVQKGLLRFRAARPTTQGLETHLATMYKMIRDFQPRAVVVDPTRLAQIFSNLLSNAAKYTNRGGQITLTAERQGDDVAVSVRDSGIGIPADHLPKLFEMLSQVDSALDRARGGLGIGLALVRGLVEMHGGTVEAHSGGTGKGSQFTVRLPIAESPDQPPQKPTRTEEPAGLGDKIRILVADDNKDATRILARLLTIMGHDICTAHDGLEAVQQAATFRPRVVLLDIGMPRMNGYEVARSIRAEPGGDEVILAAVTGWGQEEDKRRAAEAGFDYHLTKPIEAAVVQKLLAEKVR